MGYLAKNIFPFRVFSFVAIYIMCNIVLYTISPDYNGSSNPITKYYQKTVTNSIVSPNLASSIKDAIIENMSDSQFVKDKQKSIKIMLIFADIFLVFIFVAIIFGFASTLVQLCFIEAFLHFIGIILIGYCIVEEAHINFIICGVVFGVYVPALMELWQVISLFIFKTDFY